MLKYGRILPGATRAVVIELARHLGFEVVEQPLELGRLAGAEEIFLTGSVAGVEPVKHGPVTARLLCAWRASVGLPAPRH